MSLTFSIAHICDHVVRMTTESKKSLTFLTSGDTIEIFQSVTISKVDYIVGPSNELYFAKINFRIIGTNKIEWLNNQPTAGTQVTMVYYSDDSLDMSYPADSCPRCSGNGWFVDMANPIDKAIGLATGAEKMVQDFLKILLTDSRYYVMGTSLKSAVGVITRSDEELKSKVMVAIREAETKLKKIQYEMLLDAKEVPSEELLKSVIIEEIEVLETRDGCYVSVTLVNESSYAYQIGLEL